MKRLGVTTTERKPHTLHVALRTQTRAPREHTDSWEERSSWQGLLPWGQGWAGASRDQMSAKAAEGCGLSPEANTCATSPADQAAGPAECLGGGGTSRNST